MKKPLQLGLLPILILLTALLACAVNPVTGKKEFMLVSQADEVALGRQTDAEVVEQYGLYQDAALQSYISALGKKMSAVTHRPELQYEFKVLDTDVLNAFAVPGGYVYFTREIMAYLNDEAELAGVMGHELGHIAARHSAKQMTQAQLMSLGLGLGSALSETFAKYAGIASFGVQMLFLRFSRDNERQADQLGVEYMTKSGYDGEAMAEFFTTLERLNPEDGSVPAWFSTHPNPVDRVAAVLRYTQEWKQQSPGTAFSRNRDAYLKKIENIVVGQDPRQGFVQNGVFYHPGLALRFPVPSGWTLNNLASQVQTTPASQDAAILFSISQGADPSAAASQFAVQSAAIVSSRQSASIHGMPAVLMQSDIQGQDTLRVYSAFIKKDAGTFVFHGLGTRENYASYLSSFRNVAQGFQKVADPKILNVKPKRIRLQAAKMRTSVRNALLGMNVKTGDLEAVAILNGLNQTDVIEKGTLLKTVAE
ncbi:M48 family metalloprotease [bacterium]|nr:M48 family metalloprotease [bacterium]